MALAWQFYWLPNTILITKSCLNLYPNDKQVLHKKDCFHFMLHFQVFFLYMFVICDKTFNFLQDLTGGSFEENLKSLKLREGIDYIHFSWLKMLFYFTLLSTVYHFYNKCLLIP